MSCDQTILFWNQQAERIPGLPADQVIGRRCYEVATGLVSGGITPASNLRGKLGANSKLQRFSPLCASESWCGTRACSHKHPCID